MALARFRNSRRTLSRLLSSVRLHIRVNASSCSRVAESAVPDPPSASAAPLADSLPLPAPPLDPSEPPPPPKRPPSPAPAPALSPVGGSPLSGLVRRRLDCPTPRSPCPARK